MAEPIPLNAWRARLQIGSKGEKKTLYNLMMYLRNLPGLGSAIRYNELSGMVEWKSRPIRDADYIDMQIMVEQAGFQPNKTDIPAAVARLAFDHAYHPVRDYIDGLEWDGVNRLDRFLPILFGAEDTPYVRAVGARWMIGAVARVYEPGCKMDTMLVLEGKQGLRKSSALRALFGAPFFTEMVTVLRDHKGFVEQILGKWVVEFAELASLKGADIELAKGVIAMQVDKIRPSYGRNTVDYPRRCVLAASVNPKSGQGYLKDTTGNRRFWPVSCTAIDIEKLTRKRDQLWAEAVKRYQDGEQWWLTAEEDALAAIECDARMQTDAWEEVVERELVTNFTYTSTQILTDIIKMPIERHDQRAKDRIATVMKSLGWEQPKSPVKIRQADGSRKSTRVWRFGGEA